jgi:hypothetical protein
MEGFLKKTTAAVIDATAQDFPTKSGKDAAALSSA